MMYTFREYMLMENVVASKRQGIQHFHAMKPVEFIQWARTVKKDMKGILKNIKTVLKVDGLGARFGVDTQGRVFFEGSRTGPIFDDNAFSNYAKSKGSSEEVILRAKHYDDMLKLFRSLKWVRELPKDTKVYSEIFYNPMAEETKDGIRFVTISYDKTKLGSLMTILPYDIFYASTGEVREDKQEILNYIQKASTNKVKIIDPSLKMDPIDINGIIDPISTFLNNESLRILQSRKKEDKEAKENIISIIQKVKEELEDYIIFNPNICGLNKLCKPEKGEGIVLHLPHGTFKMTSKEFQQAHHGN